MIEYFKLYEEASGLNTMNGLKALSYYIPVKKVDDETVEAFVLDYKQWRYDDQLVGPEAWEEEFTSDTSYTKILNMNKTPKKRQLFKLVFSLGDR